MNNLLELKNITKKYNLIKKLTILKKINYKFKKGTIYSIMGPSGSGKTTLLNILGLLDKPTSGEILIKDKKIFFNNNEKIDKVRGKNIGIIYQQNNLLSDFTALENVYLARLSISDDKKQAIFDAKKIITKLGLANRLNHYPSELSGGEQQRIAISRALINKPELILADEPTGSLDQVNAKEVFKILFKLSNENNTIIFATHNRYFANMADCKLGMIDGIIKTINETNH